MVVSRKLDHLHVVSSALILHAGKLDNQFFGPPCMVVSPTITRLQTGRLAGRPLVKCGYRMLFCISYNG